MSKTIVSAITLLKGLGVQGDAHLGKRVKHRSRVRANPNQPNLRQVHLIQSELLEELFAKGFHIQPGDMGENIFTVGIDLLALPCGTILKIGPEARVEITGLRNPCNQLNGIKPGLMQALLDKDEDGNLVRKAGIMGVVLHGGEVKPADQIEIMLPPLPHIALDRV
ncbi:MAG: MOSC domain-containing protein YiiM [Flavobacteriales bacterium]|jgi:MOSC domain-containing protein YiiM